MIVKNFTFRKTDAQLCKVMVKHEQDKLGLTLGWLDVAEVHNSYTVVHHSAISKQLSGEVKYIDHLVPVISVRGGIY